MPVEKDVTGRYCIAKWFGRIYVQHYGRHHFTNLHGLWNTHAESYLSTRLSDGRAFLIVRAEDLVHKPLEVNAELSQCGLTRKATVPRPCWMIFWA